MDKVTAGGVAHAYAFGQEGKGWKYNNGNARLAPGHTK